MKEKIWLVLINSFIVIVCIIICLVFTKSFFKPNEDIEETTEEINSIVLSKMDMYYNSVFDRHSSNFCGDLNYSDTYDVYYINTRSYGSIDEARNFFKSFVSDKYIEDNLIKNFKDHSNKLYCLAKEKSDLKYKQGSFRIVVLNKTKSKIDVEGVFETVETDLNPSETFDMKATFIRENDNWVIDSYLDVYNKES